MRLKSVALLNGLGSMEETTSAGSGTSKAAKGFAELYRTLISSERFRKLEARSGPGILSGCTLVINR